MSQDHIGIPYKVTTVVRKWDNVSTKGIEREEDSSVILDDVWYDADGSLVTDPQRIQQLELLVTTHTE